MIKQLWQKICKVFSSTNKLEENFSCHFCQNPLTFADDPFVSGQPSTYPHWKGKCIRCAINYNLASVEIILDQVSHKPLTYRFILNINQKSYLISCDFNLNISCIYQKKHRGMIFPEKKDELEYVLIRQIPGLPFTINNVKNKLKTILIFS